MKPSMKRKVARTNKVSEGRQVIPLRHPLRAVNSAKRGRKAVYAGSFDPITNGHIDIVRRSLDVFDQVIVALAHNPGKDRSLFTAEERVELIRQTLADVSDRVLVDTFEGLLVDYCDRVRATVIVRGLRAVSDFEYEFQMAGMNRNLHPEVETLFLTPAEQYLFMSSTIVREIARFGGDVGKFVPPAVVARLKVKADEERAAQSRERS